MNRVSWGERGGKEKEGGEMGEEEGNEGRGGELRGEGGTGTGGGRKLPSHNPILDTRISSVRTLSGSYYPPPSNLIRVLLESSGQIASS